MKKNNKESIIELIFIHGKLGAIKVCVSTVKANIFIFEIKEIIYETVGSIKWVSNLIQEIDSISQL